MIRTAEASDIAAIEALMNSVPGFWDHGWPQDLLERVLGFPGTIALVHEDGLAVNGFACAHDVGFRAYLSELDAQRRGIGSSLLSEVERRLAGRGSHLVIADVWADAQEFYRARGWAPPAAVLLRKRLPTVPPKQLPGLGSAGA